jgi:hypothetical protein
VGMVFAAREPGEELQNLSGLGVRGLDNGDARALLGPAVRFSFDERMRERIIAETNGNPLALLELRRGLGATQLAVGFGLMDPQSRSERIEETFIRRLEALSGTQGVCCCWPRRSRWATRFCSGERQNNSASTPDPPILRRAGGCWRSRTGCSSVTHWSARRFTGRPRSRIAGRCIWRWRRRRIGTLIRTDGRGISPRRQWSRMRRSRPS